MQAAITQSGRQFFNFRIRITSFYWCIIQLSKKRVAHYNGEAKENYHQLNKTQYVHQQLLEPKSRSRRWVNTELVIVR